MLVVGLTGGIGSGKSTVARLFSDLHVPVFDTDIIARELVEPGHPALDEIIQTFGKVYLEPDGQLNRQKLKEMIFNDDASRVKLEAILHPRIRETLLLSITRCSSPYCIAVIPLLVEHHWQEIVDRVLVVDTEEQLQIQRVSDRDQLTTDTIKKIIDSQVSRSVRLSVADDIIRNNANLDELKAQVEALHVKYLELANPNNPSSR